MAGFRKTAVTVVVAALALTATACGSKGGSASGTGNRADAPPAKLTPAAMLKLVAEKTGAAKSAKVHQEVEITGNGVLVYNGAISWADGLKGELAVDAGDSAMGKQMKPLTGSTTLRYRYFKDAMYLKLGSAATTEFNGRSWLRYGYDDLSRVMGPAGDSMKNQLRNADPQAAVRALIAAGKVSEAGDDTVDGKAATRYTGDLTAADLATAGSRGLDAQQAEELKAQLEGSGITTEHVEVWIDKESKLLLKRLEQADTANGTVKLTVDYSDYGTKVDTVEPGASEAVDFTELLKKS